MLDCNRSCFKYVATPSISCCIYLSELEIAYCLCYGFKHEIYSWNGSLYQLLSSIAACTWMDIYSMVGLGPCKLFLLINAIDRKFCKMPRKDSRKNVRTQTHTPDL
jgi:hypothetical protein